MSKSQFPPPADLDPDLTAGLALQPTPSQSKQGVVPTDVLVIPDDARFRYAPQDWALCQFQGKEYNVRVCRFPCVSVCLQAAGIVFR